MNRFSLTALALSSALLAGCMTAPTPVEVTRFLQPAQAAQLGQGTVFIASAGGLDSSGIVVSEAKRAVAAELAALGYRETNRAEADQIVEVAAQRFAGREGNRRSPVDVGVGGSTGTYGSGVGVGLGINLGGGNRERVTTEVFVAIKGKDDTVNLWEARANFTVDAKSDLADPSANAAAMADAIFRDFPGNNGETIEVKVK